MVDRLDNRIITLLKRDGRSSNTTLAKELNINIATITRRINKMLREETIEIKAVLNPFKVAYNTHAVIALDIDLVLADRVAAYLVNNSNISLVATTFGRYAMLLLADFPTLEILQEYITKELPRIEGIKKIDVFPIIENKKVYNPLFKNDTNTDKPASIDETDKILVEELEKNGRASYAGLAHKLGISLATVSRRVARLYEQNIIKISAIRNPARLGYLANAYIFLRADLNKVNTICAALGAHQEVHMIMTLMSGFEILAGIHLRSPETLYKFIVEKIAVIKGVTNLETFICAEIKKRSYPLLDSEAE